MRSKNLSLVVLSLLLSATLLSRAHAQGGEPNSSTGLPVQYAATAFGQSGPFTGKSFGINIYITDWTTNQQRNDFLATLKKDGPDGLVKAFEKTKDVGRVAPTGYVGNGFRYTRSIPTANGGSHIVMVTDRAMSFGEVYYSGRSVDYPFGIIVLDVDKDGKGTGQLAPVCKIKFNKKGELVIENYGQKPFRLANVYISK